MHLPFQKISTNLKSRMVRYRRHQLSITVDTVQQVFEEFECRLDVHRASKEGRIGRSYIFFT